MNALDLFTGIGGITLALRDYVRPVAYCEIDPYCQSVLLQRMREGHLPKAPIWDDIRTLRRDVLFDAGILPPRVDIVYGGFPCQDISCVGAGKGLEGERSGLFFEIKRLCCDLKPRFIFLENVPAITSRGGTRVVREIASVGYDCRWCVISASSLGALHRRERWFLFARKNDRNSCGVSSVETNQPPYPFGLKGGSWGDNTTEYWPFESREHWKEVVSTMGKCSDGLSYQVDRLRALGNAVVPQQVTKAFKILAGLNHGHKTN